MGYDVKRLVLRTMFVLLVDSGYPSKCCLFSLRVSCLQYLVDLLRTASCFFSKAGVAGRDTPDSVTLWSVDYSRVLGT